MSNNKLEELLKKLALENGITTAEVRKKMDDYKFWKTQPVASLDETVDKEGPIDKVKTPEEIRDEPYPMLPAFEWCDIDINNPNELEDLFILLNENYVEDKDATFRFNYTKDFFNWALKSPGWRSNWHVGVRASSSGKLIAFISAIPVTLDIRGNALKSVEINFLCIHKQLRSKRLAPVLIKEITRRVNKENIWQALYTSGTILPSPVSVCRYTHRPINWSKLYDVGFTGLPPSKTTSDMLAMYALPNKTQINGLRPMEMKDIDQTFELFQNYQSRFDIKQIFTKDEFKHWFLGGDETQFLNIIYSYVVEDENGKITDFVSFYSLPFSILNNAIHKQLGIGYLFYYATDIDSEFDDKYSEESTKLLSKRLNVLINDATILAKQAKMDVFNALTSQDNVLFLENLKFGPGDGFLNFYLFNYKAFPIASGLNKDKTYDLKGRSKVGVVML